MHFYSLKDKINNFCLNNEQNNTVMINDIIEDLSFVPIDEFYDIYTHLITTDDIHNRNIRSLLYNGLLPHMKDILFFINSTYSDINSVKLSNCENPQVFNCQIAYDNDGFNVLDQLGNPITYDFKDNITIISNASFRENEIEKAVRLIMQEDTYLIVSIDNEDLIINGLGNDKCNETVYTEMGISKKITFKCRMDRYHDENIHYIYNMYSVLRN